MVPFGDCHRDRRHSSVTWWCCASMTARAALKGSHADHRRAPVCRGLLECLHLVPWCCARSAFACNALAFMELRRPLASPRSPGCVLHTLSNTNAGESASPPCLVGHIDMPGHGDYSEASVYEYANGSG